ncbi:DUF3048 domain-containing protein [Candidatus Peregrinibacteria bacterium]|nr:DUF3048 domain-containing protein [Candidatus Peregrinibacteria bacterium]
MTTLPKTPLKTPSRGRLIFLLLFVAVATVAWAFFLLSFISKIQLSPSPAVSSNSSTPLSETAPLPATPEKPTTTSLLTGKTINLDRQLKTPVAVVIENLVEARPQQKGLEEADIVYETVAEGGITRFLAIYGENRPLSMGPVRSARPYFVDWAKEYSGAFVHVGGSPDAMEALTSSGNILNIDEQLDNPVIARDKDYAAPHNAFTSMEGVVDWITRSHFKHALKAPRFTFETPTETLNRVQVIAIDFSTSLYAVKYIFNSEKQTYERKMAGEPHQDIHPTNVLIQFTDQQVVDDVLRMSIQTQGTGKAILFHNGEVIHGSWQKNENDMTQFYNQDNRPMTLSPGQTWIEVVSKDTKILL